MRSENSACSLNILLKIHLEEFQSSLIISRLYHQAP